MGIKRITLLVSILSLVILVSCSRTTQQKKNSTEKKICICAAAGTRLATEEICNSFETNKNIVVERNYASSGVLARQITNGAECDVFVSANKQWIDFLVKKKLLDINLINKIAGNSLAIIAPLDSKLKIQEFKSHFNILATISNKITISDPTYVPIGKYAKMVFDSLNWFETIKERTIKDKDVMSVLHYIEMGECDWEIIYHSTAVQSNKVKIIAEIPLYLHSPIVFYIGNLKEGQLNKTQLLELFINKNGQKIFNQQGFKRITPLETQP